jgi:hypothetical protein
LTLDVIPETGRLNHHLAILARPDVIKCLGLYACSLTTAQPFPASHEGIELVWKWAESPGREYSSVVSPEFTHVFIDIQRMIYKKIEVDLPQKINLCLELAEKDLKEGKVHDRWRMTSAYMAYICIASILSYGSNSSGLFGAYSRRRQDTPQMDDVSVESMTLDKASDVSESPEAFCNESACRLTMGILDVFLKANDPCVEPYIHVLLVFLWRLQTLDLDDCNAEARDRLLRTVPIESLNRFLDSKKGHVEARFENMDLAQLLQSREPGVNPLPEDFQIRGQSWSNEYLQNGTVNPYLAEDWYHQAPDVDERESKLFWNIKSHDQRRMERILWLGSKITPVSADLGVSPSREDGHVDPARKAQYMDFDPDSRTLEMRGSGSNCIDRMDI